MTKIITTGIITAGNIVTSMTNFMLYGAIFLFVLFIIGVFVIITIIKRNCSTIKNGLDMMSNKIPIPMIHLKLISSAIGLICPTQNKPK